MKRIAVTPPEWLLNSAIYQINPRTFSSEGTLAAVTRELPYLKSLNFNIIYLCPVFEEDDSTDIAYFSERQKRSKTGNPKNPYRMNDYFRIDSEYGTDRDLRELVTEAHRIGMRVILDLVYLHIGPNAPILKNHPEFAKQNPDGTFKCTIWHFPYLDFECDGLREYLWSNMTYYIGEFDIDGFRCDVGDGIPIDFWVEGRRRIRAIKNDCVLINEGANYDYLLKGFDASYCFDWHECLYKLLSHSMTAKELLAKETARKENVPSGGVLMRDLDNHDTVTDWPVRCETVGGHDGTELCEVLNYFIDGVPMVYCGNELCCEAKLSMFANRFYMGNFEVTDREALKKTDAGIHRADIMRTLNTMRKENKVLRSGITEYLDHGENVIAFKRIYDGRTAFFAGNFGRDEVQITLPETPGTYLSNKAGIIGNTAVLGEFGYIAFIC